MPKTRTETPSKKSHFGHYLVEDPPLEDHLFIPILPVFLLLFCCETRHLINPPYCQKSSRFHPYILTPISYILFFGNHRFYILVTNTGTGFGV